MSTVPVKTYGGGLTRYEAGSRVEVDADTTAQQTIATFNLVPNSLATGAVIKASVAGVMDCGTTTSKWGLVLYLNDTAIYTQTPFAPGSVSATPWKHDYHIMVRAAGTGGTVEATVNRLDAGEVAKVEVPDAVSVNTTTTFTLKLKGVWDSVDSTAKATISQMTMEQPDVIFPIWEQA